MFKLHHQIINFRIPIIKTNFIITIIETIAITVTKIIINFTAFEISLKDFQNFITN